MRSRRALELSALLLFLLPLFGFAYRKLAFQPIGLAFADLSLFPVSSERAFQAFIYCWGDNNLGSFNMESPFWLLRSFMVFLFGNYAQNIFYLSLQPIACITMYIFLTQLVEHRSAAFVASFIYSVNPVAVFYFSTGSPTLLFFYAISPLLLLFLFLILKSNKVSDVIFLGIFSAITSSYDRDAPAVFLPLVIVITLIHIFINRGAKQRWKSLFLIIGSFALVFLLLLPSYYFYFVNLPSIGQRTLTGQQPSFVQAMYSHSSIPNVLRLLGPHLEWGFSTLYGGTWAEALGYAFPLLAFSSPLFIRGRRRRKDGTGEYAIVSFLITAVLVIAFFDLTRQGLTLNLFVQIPILFVFRDSAKLMQLLTLAYSPLIAVTINQVINRIETLGAEQSNTLSRRIPCRKILKLLKFCFCMAIITTNVFYNSYFLTSGDGAIGLIQSIRYRDNPDHQNYRTLPVYRQVSAWNSEKRKSEGYFRTLWLPYDYTTKLTLPTGLDDYTFHVFPSTLFGEVSGGMESTSYMLSTIEKLGQTKKVGTLLSSASVKYLIIRKNSQWEGEPRIWYNKSYARYLCGNPK